MEQRQLFKVRDLRKKDQFKIDDRYLNGYARIFGVSTTAVYSSLCRHAEFYSQKAFPSERLIAEEHNISIRTVRRAIEKLKSANIVNIEKVRSSKGQWLNNTYFLIDKLEWKKPEDIKDLWETRGQKQQEPEDIRDATRGHHVSIKDNTLRRITHKKDNILAKQSFAGKEINDLIDSSNKELSSKSLPDKPAEWNLEKELEKILTDPKRHIEIIGVWIREMKLRPENKDQMQSIIKRFLRPAKLLEGYKNEDIVETIKVVQNTDYIKKITLETLLKFIDEVVANKKKEGPKILRFEEIKKPNGSIAMRPIYEKN